MGHLSWVARLACPTASKLGAELKRRLQGQGQGQKLVPALYLKFLKMSSVQHRRHNSLRKIMLTEGDCTFKIMSINLFVHISRGSKSNPKWLYLMNSQHIKEKRHAEGNKKMYFKKHWKRCLYCLSFLLSIFYWTCQFGEVKIMLVLQGEIKHSWL